MTSCLTNVMKMKNILFILHIIVFMSTLGLHLDSFYFNSWGFQVEGLLAQIVLGFIQISTALYFFINWKKHHRVLRTHLKIYWSIVCFYVLIACSDLYVYYSFFDKNVIFGYIPMSIAAYFVSIMYIQNRTLKKSNQE